MHESRFRTTSWSLIAEAARGQGSAAGGALADLCQAYWPPVYAFVRRSGFSPEQAEDLTQDFFADLVDSGPLIRSADPALGKFRTYLLAAVKHAIANHHRDATAIKRGGRTQTFSIDATQAEQRYASEPTDGWTAEAIFHRRWALTLLENVLDRIGQEYTEKDRQSWFESLRPYLTSGDNPSYDALAEQLDTTPAAIRVAVHRLRKQYREALSAEIRATLGPNSEVADERTELLHALTGQ